MLRKILSLFKKPEVAVAIEPVIAPVVADPSPTVTEIKITDTVTIPVDVKIVTKKAVPVIKKTISKPGRSKK